jgi:uncharacterized membrane protein YraQ (UPF0718 family)
MFHASLTGNRSPLLTAALQSASFSPLVRLHGEFAMSSRESGRKRAPDGSAISQGVVNVTELALKWPRENPKGFLLLAPFVWIGLYQALIPVSGFFVSVLPVDRASYLSGALQFFFYDMPKVLLLLTGIVFVMGMINSHFTPERTRALLAGRTGSVANVMAAILGIVTPFCSCSAVPLFIGFVQAGVPLGVTFSFLIAAPMVNEVALTLLFALFGWKIALLYLGLGLSVAIAAGWVIGRLKMEAHLEDWVRDIPRVRGATSESSLTLSERIDAGFAAMREIVGKVWPYIVAGIGVGAAIHGYVPENFMASLMGKDAWWAVPLAVVIGVPMYSNAAGIIPIVQALLAKGAALGSALAFMMSVIALSLPEMIILRKVLKARLIATFVGVVAAGILLVGYVFNAVL